jgi:hypothetical protein
VFSTKRPDLGTSGLSVPLLNYGAEQELVIVKIKVIVNETLYWNIPSAGVSE